jgi:archaellum biogenesis protein FlaJ (TadC family)
MRDGGVLTLDTTGFQSSALVTLLLAFGSVGAGGFLWVRASDVGNRVARSLVEQARPDPEPSPKRPDRGSSIEYTRLVARLLGASFFAAFGLCLNHATPARIVVYAVLGVVLGDLVTKGHGKRKEKTLTRRLEFALPMAMERVVMAVGSGLDILPALSEVGRKSTDPVSEIFRRIVSLSEGGMRVEHALQIVADGSPSSSVKHALVHLGLAYKQGGEVIRPLKELSDATQTHYQEVVEEEIAKLPVKAVLPLIITFTGLIICFLTVPIVQVGDSLERFSHDAK